MCGTRLGAEDAGDMGARGRRVARQASDGTHLAGKLHATHAGEAHDGGCRGVESGGGVGDLWRFSIVQVNDGSRDPDKPRALIGAEKASAGRSNGMPGFHD